MFVCLFPTSTWRKYLFSVTFLGALHTVYIHNKYKLLQGLETVRPPRIIFFLHFWKDRIARHVFKSPSALPKAIFKITDQITIKNLRIELLKDPHLTPLRFRSTIFLSLLYPCERFTWITSSQEYTWLPHDDLHQLSPAIYNPDSQIIKLFSVAV